jgi:hypothetical protein
VLEMEHKAMLDIKHELVLLFNESNRTYEISILDSFKSLLVDNITNDNLNYQMFYYNPISYMENSEINKLYYILGIEDYKDYIFYNNENY